MASPLSPTALIALIAALQRVAKADGREECRRDFAFLLAAVKGACLEIHGNAAPLVQVVLERRTDTEDVFDLLAESDIYRDLFWDPDYLTFTKTLQLKSRALADRKRAAVKETT